jgi:hypothetical protein
VLKTLVTFQVFAPKETKNDASATFSAQQIEVCAVHVSKVQSYNPENMVLLDEIIALATDMKQPLTLILRKCLILGYQLRNDRLKAWANQELNGYNSPEDLPKYRGGWVVSPRKGLNLR